MSKENENIKLDGHIRSQLDQLSSEPSSWSQDDAIRWDILQPKIDDIFRKKKKKAIILLLGMLFTILLGVGFFHLFNSTLIVNSNYVPPNIAESSETSMDQNSTFEGLESIEPQKASKIILDADDKDKIRRDDLLNMNTKKGLSSISSALNAGKSSFYLLESNTQESALENVFLVNPAKNNIDPKVSNTKIPSTISNDDFNSSIKSIVSLIDETNRGNLNTSLIQSLRLNSLKEKESSVLKNLEASAITPSTDLKSKWEIGIGHTQFIDNPFLFIPPAQLTDNKNVQIVDKRYESYNFLVNRRVGRNFSLSSGLHYIKQYIQLNYTLTDFVYDEEENTFRNSLSDIVGRSIGPLSDGLQEDQLFIKLLPGKELNVGDLLRAEGFGDAYARIYQVPIQLNYHKTFGRLEVVAFTGISLNAIYVEIPRFEVEIYSNNDLVSNDINFTPIADQVFVPNLILGGGIRYKFMDRYYTNLYYNHNPLDTRFARVQFGLTYSL